MSSSGAIRSLLEVKGEDIAEIIKTVDTIDQIWEDFVANNNCWVQRKLVCEACDEVCDVNEDMLSDTV